ncbi:MAG TPA: hypothetical protein VFL85_01800 [Candidatus Saccharimonadales bacterium]|nr:hypothetical protein [Candidatus Saccharimonadales bacterium]
MPLSPYQFDPAFVQRFFKVTQEYVDLEYENAVRHLGEVIAITGMWQRNRAVGISMDLSDLMTQGSNIDLPMVTKVEELPELDDANRDDPNYDYAVHSPEGRLAEVDWDFREAARRIIGNVAGFNVDNVKPGRLEIEDGMYENQDWTRIRIELTPGTTTELSIGKYSEGAQVVFGTSLPVSATDKAIITGTVEQLERANQQLRDGIQQM